MLTAMQLIEQELARHQEKGFDLHHDRNHMEGSLIMAALEICETVEYTTNRTWPFDLADHVKEKYQSSPVQRLVIAASLLVAEINRRLSDEAHP